MFIHMIFRRSAIYLTMKKNISSFLYFCLFRNLALFGTVSPCFFEKTRHKVSPEMSKLNEAAEKAKVLIINEAMEKEKTNISGRYLK